VTESTTRRAKGQTLAYILEVNSTLKNPDVTAILKYRNTKALAQHSDCDGKPHPARVATPSTKY
jgi:hypothetical protein